MKLPWAVVRIANAATNLALLCGIPRPPYNRGNALIVETIGRRSRKRRRIPVGYLDDGGRIIVVVEDGSRAYWVRNSPRTNCRMPDLCSIGVGGGSLIDRNTGAVGPRSVGFRLTEEALVFGGTTLTLTDIAVAAGRVEIGEPAHVRDIGRRVIASVDAHLGVRFERLLESFEQSGQVLPVVLVGGGAPLVAHLFGDRGREVISPPYASVANAYGAAIAQVGGEVDLTFSLATISRAAALARAEREAYRRAAEAGAQAGTIRTVELEDAALTYLASDALRVRAKAVGDL